MFAYQRMTNTGHWHTVSEHGTSGDAQSCLGSTQSLFAAERVIDKSYDPPRLIVCQDPSRLPSADWKQ